MPLTREFKETVQARIKADRKYRKELLREDDVVDDVKAYL